MRRTTAGLCAAVLAGTMSIAGYLGTQASRNFKNESVAAMEKYHDKIRAVKSEYEMADNPYMAEISPPVMVPNMLSSTRTFSFDLNDDHVPEIISPNACAAVGCDGAVYVNRKWGSSNYFPVARIRIDRVSKDKTNGYRNVFVSREVNLNGGLRTSVRRHVYDGEKYVPDIAVEDPEVIDEASRHIARFFSRERSPKRRVELMRYIETSIGMHNAVYAFLQYQTPEGVNILRDDFLGHKFALEYARESGIAGFADIPPKELESMMFSSFVDPSFLTCRNPKCYATVGAKAAAQSVAKDLGRDAISRFSETLNNAEGGIGWMNAYKTASGHLPRTAEELRNAATKGGAFAMTEDKLPVIRGQDTSTYRRSESPSGTTESRRFTPGGVTGDPNYRNYQTPQQSIQEKSQQMDRDTQERARQFGNQLENKGRELSEKFRNMFKPKDPKQ